MIRLCCSVVLALASSASCAAKDDPSPGTTSSADDDSSDSSTGAASITLEQCDELLTQAECEAAVIGGNTQDTCAWFDVLVPGPTCESDVVVPQCVGMSFVGAGCQAFSCPSSATIDGFFRTVDGQVQVFENPPSDCGLAAMDGWSACIGTDVPAECQCLCPE